MGIIDNDLFTQTNPNPNSPRNNPSLAGQLTNLNNEINSIEETLVEGYVRESASVSYVSSSSFTVSGDVTAIYTNGRIVRFSDGTTGIVSSSSYSSTTAKTTVTMLTGTVPSSLSYVDIAIQAKGQTSGLASRVLGDNNVVVVSQKDSDGTARDILKLNSSNDLEIGGAGISSYKLNNSIIKPSSDSTSAIKITKANGTSHILNIDTINQRVGIGTENPAKKLHIYDTNSNGGLRLEGGSDGPNIEWRTGTTRHWNIDQEGASPKLRFFTEDSSDGAGAVRMLITESGDVGIGTENPAYRLDVNGQCHASSFPTSSDKRFKENVKEIDNALEKVKKLRGVYFNWNKFYRETLKVDETEDTEIGLIAQEVKKVIPEVVTTFEREVDDKKEKYYSVEYARISALLINAIKELAEKVENLEKKYGEINNSRT
jgi:thiamine phosphate synthase YjbQ (UPF0047 family)